jgi:HlyD family secretion protein
MKNQLSSPRHYSERTDTGSARNRRLAGWLRAHTVRVRRQDRSILRQLRTLYNLGTIGDLTDGQLLERFATDGNEVAELAFSALVERHEAMVWRVCLAIVGDEHEAEDAFQATFLVLVRKARSLWVRDSLGPWLHQVACRTASALRTTVIRRRKHEHRFMERAASRSVEAGTPRDPDLDAAVQEEVNRLPEKYRAPVVLCDLEGRTHQEAARCLGWPIGTVKSRQSQGRRLIRDRLVRRGLGLAVAAAVAESLTQTAIATMPRKLSLSTVNAVMQQSDRLITGIGVSAHVLTLTQGVLRAMLWIRLRLLIVATVAVGIASGGAGVYVLGSQDPAPKDGQPGGKPPASTPELTPKDGQPGGKLPVSTPEGTPTPKDGQPVGKPPGSTPELTPPPKSSAKATGQPAPGTPPAKLRAQQLATRKAKASYDIAKATRELAEIAVEEFEEVNSPRELAAVEGEIALAESDLIRAQDRLEWARRMFEKGYVSGATKTSEELTRRKAMFSLEQAQHKRDVSISFFRAKTIKQLRSEVEKARADEVAKENAWIVEKVKEIDLERWLHPESK